MKTIEPIMSGSISSSSSSSSSRTPPDTPAAKIMFCSIIITLPGVVVTPA